MKFKYGVFFLGFLRLMRNRGFDLSFWRERKRTRVEKVDRKSVV